MSTINKNNKTDGDLPLTTLDQPRTSTDGRDDETVDGLTTVTDVQTLTATMTVTDGQVTAAVLNAAELATVDGGDPLECSSIAMTAAEGATVDDEELLVCSPVVSAADETTGGESSAAPMSSAPATPLLPRRGSGSAAGSSPSTSGRTRTGLRSQALEAGASHAKGLDKRYKRTAGPKKMMVAATGVEDVPQVLTQDDCAMSVTSGDEDSSMASSSGVPRRKGIKRIRDGGKDKVNGSGSKGKAGEEEQEGKKRKKKKDGKGKETPEEEERNGPDGEPKGVVGHSYENMASSVLGGAITQWVDQIEDMRKRSKNLHGKFSGDMKNLLAQIKEGTALLVVRTESAGDPHFLRMRNTELMTRMKEMEKDNSRLKDQVRKSTPGADSPPRKKKVEKLMPTVVNDGAEYAVVSREVTPVAVESGSFPPLPQRTPRNRTQEAKAAAQRAPPLAAHRFSDMEDTEAESYLTQQINLLLAARNLERDRKRKEGQDRTKDGRQDIRNRTGEWKRTDEVRDGGRRVGPRILSDVQLVPPSGTFPMHTPDVSAAEEDWRVATGGRKKRRNMERRAMPPPPPRSAIGTAVPGWRSGGGGADHHVPPPRRPPGRQTSGVRLPKPPKSSAVTITGVAQDFSYANALRGARERIDIEALGIQISRTRKAINGGLLIEIPGENSRTKAEELTTRLRSVFGDTAMVSCPIKKREIRVVGFDESITQREIGEALSTIGECPFADVRVGVIRTMNNGLGTVWAQLPIAAALKAAEVGRARVGWTIARIELLRTRPLQCYRCWAYGHVQGVCRSAVDRRGLCFNCGQHGHAANRCGNPALCIVCRDSGLDASHRLRGPRCLAQTQPGAMLDRRPAIVTNDNVPVPTNQSE